MALFGDGVIWCAGCGGYHFARHEEVVLPDKVGRLPLKEHLEKYLDVPYVERRVFHVCANPHCRKELSL